MKIFGLAASLRSKLEDKHVDAVRNIKEFEEFLYLAEKLGRDQDLSNSDLCLLGALYGAHKSGAEIDAIRLSKENSVVDIANAVNQDGVSGFILSTPVYFGDNSSLAQEFFAHARNLNWLHRSAFGVVSVGAKRNGGQETANVWSLSDALLARACCVGNGPKTSQYGGTAWAGDFGSVRNDDSGIETSIATGTNVWRCASLIEEIELPKSMTLNIVTLTDRIDRCFSNNEINGAKYTDLIVDDTHIDVYRYNLDKCMACPTCPGKNEELYKCRVKDDFEMIHKQLLNADIVVLDVKDTWRYRQILERMRFIRRDDLKMGYIPFTCYDKDIYMRSFWKFLRQDMIILPRITANEFGTDNLVPDIYYLACLIKQNKLTKGNFNHTYVPVGYGGD